MGAAINWHRVIEQVLSLLRQDQPARYQRFDWETQRLKEWHNVPVGGIVILEGLYSIRRELAEYLSYRIWVEIPRDVGMERGIARDGKGSRSWWLNEWIPDEDRYIDEERPAEGALLIVDGSTIGLALLEKGQYLQVG
jgi:uridine kinase